MIKFIFFLLLFLYSCAYPDIDTVPDFKELNISINEAIDLCKISNSDNKLLSKCIDDLNINNK